MNKGINKHTIYVTFHCFQGKMSSLMVEMESEARVNNDLNLKMKELSKLKIDNKMLKDDLSVSDDRYFQFFLYSKHHSEIGCCICS